MIPEETSVTLCITNTFSITTDQLPMKKNNWQLTKIIVIGPNEGTTIRGQQEATYWLICPEVDFIRFPVMYDCLVMKKGPSCVSASHCNCRVILRRERKKTHTPQQRGRHTQQMLKSSSIKLCVCVCVCVCVSSHCISVNILAHSVRLRGGVWWREQCLVLLLVECVFSC